METEQAKAENAYMSKLALGFIVAILVFLLVAGALRFIQWTVVIYTIGYTVIVLIFEIIGSVVRQSLVGRKKISFRTLSESRLSLRSLRLPRSFSIN